LEGAFGLIGRVSSFFLFFFQWHPNAFNAR